MTCLVSAISAVCSFVRAPFQPNILVWNEPRWSKGRTYRGRLYPTLMGSALLGRRGSIRQGNVQRAQNTIDRRGRQRLPACMRGRRALLCQQARRPVHLATGPGKGGAVLPVTEEEFREGLRHW